MQHARLILDLLPTAWPGCMSFFAGFLNTRNHRRPHIRRGPLAVRPSERPEGLQHNTSNTLQLERSPNVPQVQTG